MIYLQVTLLNFSKIFLLTLFFLISCNSDSSKVPNFIDINDDIKIVKGEKNKKGCTMFYPISKSNKPMPAVIYYVNKDLEISFDSEMNNCI